MLLTLLLDPDLSKIAPLILAGWLLALGLPAAIIWLIIKFFTLKSAAKWQALIGLVFVVGTLLLCRPLILLCIAFLPI